MLSAVEYLKIDDLGLHINNRGVPEVLDVDQVILCAGQLSNTTVYDELQQLGVGAHLIGVAELAAELDAKRAIDQGYRLALAL